MGFQFAQLNGETKEHTLIRFGRLPEWVYIALIHGKKDTNIINNISNIDRWEDEGNIIYNLILPTYSTMYADNMYSSDNDPDILRIKFSNREIFNKVYSIINYAWPDFKFQNESGSKFRYGIDKPYRSYFNFIANEFIFEVCKDDNLKDICIISGIFLRAQYDDIDIKHCNCYIDFEIKGVYDYSNIRKIRNLTKMLI